MKKTKRVQLFPQRTSECQRYSVPPIDVVVVSNQPAEYAYVAVGYRYMNL